jgi:putative spermidine/putrescine transport system ATP-binding protein
MTSVEFRQITKSYSGTLAVNDVSLVVAAGEFMTLLGPSGSGKTTLLNMISGMVTPTSGSVRIGDQDVTHIPPRLRGIGMVFQNYALMPHMTVFENIAFPLRVRRLSRAEIERRTAEVLERVRLAEYARRKPKELSGGQQQRVSIARCLVYEPRLILMDEPLGALDKKLREQMQLEIKRIHQDLRVTLIYVTHDQQEALMLSDRICVMNKARIAQAGTPNDLYFRPTSEFVADFLGDSNLIPVSVTAVSGGIVDARTEQGVTLRARALNQVAAGDRIKILIRPEAVCIGTERKADRTGLRAVIQNNNFVGQSTKYLASSGDLQITALLNNHAGGTPFASGSEVWLDWSETDAVAIGKSPLT